ncbi:MAG TPA: hypothetical protein VHF69_07935 [Candidatus Synoicihabitans sp.]|nr:hypothetical protein [Candidatus Synoicihabitans sp.]
MTLFTYSALSRSLPRPRTSIGFTANQVVRVKIVVIIAAFFLLSSGHMHGRDGFLVPAAVAQGF